ncbi:hypothetical protein AGOR_G00062840 [Albula goreensis]|uniref:Ig-like domain-containing protein n=1 Tax=Albula goreensis TaxID=1534307 RepID=A0A8T3DT83_9TELE|nr:hypothetical protein AGOR_G00062840 [Albula goreensis]
MAMFITWTTGVLLSVVSFSSLGDGCVLGIVGDSAILPCIYNETDDLTTMNISIEWRKGNEVVHRTVLGEGTEVTQSMTYENRTQLFTDVVQKGDFSLLISDINVRDAQSYDCYVSRQGGQSSTPLCRVCLSTADGVQTSPVVGRASQAMWMFSTFLCVTVGILVAIALGYQIKEDYSRKRARHQHQEMEDYESSTDDERQEIIMERLDILTETNV